MLEHLSIQNFALIDKLYLDFSGRLNVLTGETGAGKSIVIDALRFVLGDRFNSSQLRNPEQACAVEAVFEIPPEIRGRQQIFIEYLPDKETQLIISRTFSPDGKNKIKINGAFVTVGQLKELGDHLIDFHGPHDHQLLLSEDSHLGMLDQLTSFGTLLTQYKDLYSEYSQLQKQLSELEELGMSRNRDLDLLKHQISELQQVSLDPSEYEDLQQESKRLNNAQKLYECVNHILSCFEEESGASENIRKAFSSMKTLTQVDEKTEDFSDLLTQIQTNTDQLISELHDYRESLTFDEQKAHEIRNKADIYDDIKRKYGPTLAQAQDFFKTASERYQRLADLTQNNKELQEKISGLEIKLETFASKITQARQKTSTTLKKTIEKELTELGIVHVQFESRVERVELNRNGHDKVTFYISPNAGESLKPLSEIVSSGEAARLMLAMKKALIKVDPIPTLIFDEIDAQIGGRLGTVTGTKLKEISKIRQVILITHLPQIAAFGDQHFKVAKAVKDNRAVTQVNLLTPDLRVKELAKMMSGEKESSISITHAQEILSQAAKI